LDASVVPPLIVGVGGDVQLLQQCREQLVAHACVLLCLYTLRASSLLQLL
jgi:hypothetical protein